ncbi:MAG TPA: EAL domain-containing protein [Labilithrix sp.]|nr:EAL domain-containing protein [Labilithrix sp.]
MRPLILVADDDPIVSVLAEAAIENAAMDVVCASTGGEAIALFGELAPDAVLLDVFMPDLDGYAVCRRLRTLPTGVTTPILMMTARDDERSIDLAYECGATDFVGKPLNPTLLGHRLRYLLRAAQAFREARESSARLSRAQRLARLAQWEVDLGTGTVRWSDIASEVLGDSFGLESASTASFLDRVHEDDRARVTSAFSSAESHSIDYRLRLADGSERLVHQEAEMIGSEGSADRRLLGATQDVTALRLAERRIERMAIEDELTGLPNRAAARHALERASEEATESGHAVAILVVGIDNLKRVNSTFGRPVGDGLVRNVARRLEELARSRVLPCGAPFVARSGEGDFVVVVPVIQVGDAARFAREILASLEVPQEIANASITSSASVGIAAWPGDGEASDSLIERAEVAMHHARQRGRGQLQFYAASMQAEVERAHYIETELRTALRSGSGLAVHYQPKVDATSGTVTGVEALIRHTAGDGPAISAMDLVRVAEEVGLIVPLGDWILRTACTQVRAWQDEGIELRMAVNVAAKQFADPGFVARVAGVLHDVGLAPSTLELEVTEGTMLEDGAAATLAALKTLGVRIALDDFGTGFSSLSYLTKLPIDCLKIDRSFIIGLGREPKSEAITAAIIGLSQSLAIDVVAEGVETELQRRFFDGRGKLSIQGWYYAKAMPGSAMAAWVRQRTASAGAPREPLRRAG